MGNDTSPRQAPWAIAGLTVTALLAFSANSLLCRAALSGGHMDPLSFTSLRLASGALFLGVLARARGAVAFERRLARGSSVALFVYAIAFSLAYVRIPAGVGALLLTSAVQLTMLGAGLSAGERLHLVEWTGLGFSVVGLVVLTRPGLSRPDPIGAFLMLGAGAAWGAYSLRGRRAGDALQMNAASFAYALPLALAASAVSVWFAETRLDTPGVLLAVASGALSSGLGYVVWYAALRGLTATRASIVQLSVPPLAAAGGVLVLGEPFSSRLLAASLLVLGGTAIAIAGRRR